MYIIPVSLELHQMWAVTLLESEDGVEVVDHLWDLLSGSLDASSVLNTLELSGGGNEVILIDLCLWELKASNLDKASTGIGDNNGPLALELAIENDNDSSDGKGSAGLTSWGWAGISLDWVNFGSNSWAGEGDTWDSVPCWAGWILLFNWSDEGEFSHLRKGHTNLFKANRSGRFDMR